MTHSRWAFIVMIAALGCGPRRVESSCSTSFASLAEGPSRLIASDNARDLAGVLSGYTDDVVWLPPTGQPLSGKAAIRPRYEQLFSDFTVALTSEVVEAKADGSVGFARGFTRGTLTPVREGAPVVVDDKFLAVIRCEAGTWRVSHLTWSPVSADRSATADSRR